jgi:hypothetical protein
LCKNNRDIAIVVKANCGLLFNREDSLFTSKTEKIKVVISVNVFYKYAQRYGYVFAAKGKDSFFFRLF